MRDCRAGRLCGWKLAVSDNGVGKPGGGSAPVDPGLGTGIVKALSRQLDARAETLTGPAGTTVSITHAAVPTAAIRAVVAA